MFTLDRRTLLKGGAATMLAAPAISLRSRTANAADPVRAIMFRYPASEVYAAAMKKVDGVELDIQMMPNDKATELVNINLSSGSDSFDIIPCNAVNLASYVAKDWVIPLDELWNKYKDEYNLDGIDPNLVKSSSAHGHIYQAPNEFNSHLMFYRKDLYEDKGLDVPQTVDQLKQNAEKLNSDKLAGIVLMMRAGPQCASAANYYFYNVGDGWFDENWQPLFNTENGVKAAETMREMGKMAQRGFTSAAGDEGALALYQGMAGQGHMWATRAHSMNDPKKSRFVGKFGFAVPYPGNQRVSVSGLAISKFTKKDPDMLFRVMIQTLRKDVMRDNIANTIPTRPDVLNDPEFADKYPHLRAAAASGSVGRNLPIMPYTPEVTEIFTRRLNQAVTDEMKSQEAMDLATKETKDLLTSNGFYKS